MQVHASSKSVLRHRTHSGRPSTAWGKLDEAVGALREVIKRRERVLGTQHPFVVENREWLAEWRAEAEARPDRP
ncbi:tetratricopeptide repeat protein [Streptomyces malaysiensis]|uniref:tetratricopeptide repeat protein n=1 Tax=Streptomyces malaysiensis TaxID=92644 RepID=UPI002B30E425|nr:tetratricopeptide repeat protein [Streptomyces malaysiensis]